MTDYFILLCSIRNDKTRLNAASLRVRRYEDEAICCEPPPPVIARLRNEAKAIRI